ncbi:MAG TPA: acyl-CoA dehydrogenase family protein [Bryobacteraceae bacterium]|nr:acyl-CoA dehydrogenase family protein [Bryobacteraceae bacterium]
MSSTVEVLPLEALTSLESFQNALRIAEQNADDVDTRARFPLESIAALRSAGAMSWQVSHQYGGAGAKIDVLSDAAFELARRCASTGMIFAMHQIQVACILRHATHVPWFANYLQALADEQRLIASATSEAGVGGNLRKSIAAVEPASDADGNLIRFEKEASTISYGAEADDLLTTLRRSPTADHGDQVLVLTRSSDMEARKISEWNTLGMRGTCSPGFKVSATCSRDQILPVPFATIAIETMVPFSHILWANVWLGIAAAAFERSQSFVKLQARQNPGTTPPSALKLSGMSVRMAEIRSLIRSATKEYMDLADGEGRFTLSTAGYALRINQLKIAASEAVVEICQEALRVCGFLGYKNGGPYSIGRHLRDAHSAALMIANDRLRATNATLLLVHRDTK